MSAQQLEPVLFEVCLNNPFPCCPPYSNLAYTINSIDKHFIMADRNSYIFESQVLRTGM